jgi:hypothetical protein
VTHVSSSGGRRGACQGNCHQSRAPVTFFSGRRASLSNSLATAQACYKLPTPPALLSNCAPSRATSASNQPLELPNLGFSPKSPKNTERSDLAVVSSSQVRSYPLPSCLVFLCAPDTPRPTRLSYATLDRRERVGLAVDHTVTVDRAG